MHSQTLHEEKQKHQANREAKNEETEDVLASLPRLTMANHEEVIQRLCEVCLHPSRQETWNTQIAWVKKKYLAKVKEDYSDADMQVVFNRVVWTGRLEEIAKDTFWDHRKMNRSCCFCC